MTWADAIHGHAEALKDGGSPGLLSEHSIHSAIARPYDGYHRYIHQKAAALLHGVISNLYLTELFVQRSGYEFVEDDQVVVETITSVASGDMGYEELEEWFKERLLRLDAQ